MFRSDLGSLFLHLHSGCYYVAELCHLFLFYSMWAFPLFVELFGNVFGGDNIKH